MKLSKNIDWLMIFLLISTHFFTQRLNLIFVIVVFIFFLIKRNFKATLNMPGVGIYIFFLIIGIIKGLLNNNDLYIFSKQIYYFIMIILYWLVGKQETNYKEITKNRFYTSIVVFSIGYEIFEIIEVFANLRILNGLDIYTLRTQIGSGSLISIISLYILIIDNPNIVLPSSVKKFSIVLILFSILIHFSRTSLVMLFIFLIYSGLKFWKFRWFKFIIAFIIGFIAVYHIFPTELNSFYFKIINSGAELNFNNSIWTKEKIIQNWRGYEVNCAIRKFKENNILGQLLGTGFGTTIDVNGYAYLVTSEKNLSFLHNGYFTQLLVFGIIGVILYIIWLFSFYKETSKLFIEERRIIKGMIINISIITIFIMGPFFNVSISVMFYLISIMFELGKEKRKYFVEKGD